MKKKQASHSHINRTKVRVAVIKALGKIAVATISVLGLVAATVLPALLP